LKGIETLVYKHFLTSAAIASIALESNHRTPASARHTVASQIDTHSQKLFLKLLLLIELNGAVYLD